MTDKEFVVGQCPILFRMYYVGIIDRDRSQSFERALQGRLRNAFLVVHKCLNKASKEIT